MKQPIETIYQQHSRAVFATLIRLLKNFDWAEEALQEAYLSALESWPTQGIPHNPAAWLISTGRFKAIDQLRRRSHFEKNLVPQLRELEQEHYAFDPEQAFAIADDQLRLIFTCCHPALAVDAQQALTLREVCGLSTEEIASAFISKPSAIAQRIVRAKNKIRDAHIPYEIPEQAELPQRLDAVLKVIYLVFNEGYSSSRGDSPLRQELSAEAIRLARLLCQLLPPPASAAMGLLGLLLLQDSRQQARLDSQGALVLLADQDRSLWHAAQIDEGIAYTTRALSSGPANSYSLQAAIAAVHAEAKTFAQTDWPQIVGLYDRLLQVEPTAIVALNRAVAIAMLDPQHGGPLAALQQVDQIIADGQLSRYHLLYACRADFLRRLGRPQEALAAYQQALALSEQASESQFLQQRIQQCQQQLA